jgi:hypothetical protein
VLQAMPGMGGHWTGGAGPASPQADNLDKSVQAVMLDNVSW